MKRKTIWSILLVMLLLLSGCKSTGGSGDTPKGKDYDLSGKTYYNTVNEFGDEDHSWIRFNKDGTFEMIDNADHGHYEINGTWSVKNNICSLTIGGDDNPNRTTKNSFEIKDDNTLILKVALGRSKVDQTFTTSTSGWITYTQDDVKAGNVPDENGDTPNNTSTSAIPCQTIESEYTSYWSKAGSKPWNLDIKVLPENTTDEIIYKSNDENVVKVDEEGNVSAINPGSTTIEITCGDKSLTIKFETR